MPISTTLQRLVDAKNNIASAIVSMGGSVGANDGLEAFPQAIQALPSGSGGVEVDEDDLALMDQIIEGSFSSSVVTLNASRVGDYVFASNVRIIEANFPYCIEIGSAAFSGCRLQSVSFPNCSTIGSSAFQGCFLLQSVSFPNCSTIGSSAFQGCTSLQSANFPNCSIIGTYVFQGCTSLQQISIPNCSFIGYQTFYNCSSLQSVSIPSCSYIGGYAFQGCKSLQSVSFPNCSTIGSYAFSGCTSLQSIYLLSTSVCVLSYSNAFNSTPLSQSSYLGYFGSIYVPLSLLTTYQTATNWTYYASRFVGV